MTRHRRAVTLIGLGPMGQAMAEVMLAAGVEVTVWNRTPDKAEAMVEFGARRARTVAEALSASEVVVLSLTHYAAMYDVLTPAVEHLPGKVIVNLSSDAPAVTRAAGAWVRSHGAEFLCGGVMAQSDGLTLPSSYIFYSGPREVFDEHRELLRPLGSQEYLGADDGLAQLYYQAVLTVFLPWLLGFEQALATIEGSGEDIARFLPYAQRALNGADDFYAGMAAAARAGGWGDLANLRMMAAGAEHVIATGAAAGVDTGLTEAANMFWRKAIAASEAAGRAVPTYELIRGARSSG
ncbi:NAD(P)-dependent oxidoreductase [Nocardia goodfellowii]|uniref:3-hydroxyisobutyrate dehydrogenase-like beta-hydroxyacid dehydrogenase n=1 Tax=Nocardia goodfellowii TaxID=882446 RepID=A0ABS4Q9N8_9NOCA|nr:NAD(P)-binding domain-containing protein [Nocardia goodfellowii]MBP2188406.1 3-hydroxyisobutyrate dehydrogenase-like beta-hydroxyacid dehydrogenase [Nocardia goodfellowii]